MDNVYDDDYGVEEHGDIIIMDVDDRSKVEIDVQNIDKVDRNIKVETIEENFNSVHVNNAFEVVRIVNRIHDDVNIIKVLEELVCIRLGINNVTNIITSESVFVDNTFRVEVNDKVISWDRILVLN